MKKNILVTGGAGYIGSQTVLELAEAGYFPIVYDNLSTGHRKAVLAGEFIKGDLADTKKLDQVFKKYQPHAVVHFAASIEVEESVKRPDLYFENNLANGLKLLSVMNKNNCKKIVFSSTAAVYGEPQKIPIKETDRMIPINPYGLSKKMFEKILGWHQKAFGIKSISLRYFNAAGADLLGRVGQDYPSPTHLITRAILTALGRYPELKVFGTDYPTPDGTCVRDYIHVKDLAQVHILALKKLETPRFSPAYNLGTGHGYSVKEVVGAVKKISGLNFKTNNSPKRAGDPAKLVADISLAKKELGFKPKYSDLKTITKTTWDWHKGHPRGY